ncbi:hypothetical protein ALC60_13217, partial [Trachymyrmex zeteki]
DFHSRLRFTMELGGGDTLNFLDLTLIKEGNILIYDWYHKPTFSARFLKFFSCHPLCHKVGTIISLIDRVLALSHPRFHCKNFEFIINILMNNGYPLDLIFKNIKKRVISKSKLCNRTETASSNNRQNTKIKYFTIPYVPSISDKYIYIS